MSLVRRDRFASNSIIAGGRCGRVGHNSATCCSKDLTCLSCGKNQKDMGTDHRHRLCVESRVEPGDKRDREESSPPLVVKKVAVAVEGSPVAVEKPSLTLLYETQSQLTKNREKLEECLKAFSEFGDITLSIEGESALSLTAVRTPMDTELKRLTEGLALVTPVMKWLDTCDELTEKWTS
jgi:hypothetical protein